tara:strand:+ start:24001 stop:27783 length:3783 start_codon:yes stop_codon:yes gene_type:complete
MMIPGLSVRDLCCIGFAGKEYCLRGNKQALMPSRGWVYRWIPSRTGVKLPSGALVGGKEGASRIYICRAPAKAGHLHAGKFHTKLKTCFVGSYGRELQRRRFDILVAQKRTKALLGTNAALPVRLRVAPGMLVSYATNLLKKNPEFRPVLDTLSSLPGLMGTLVKDAKIISTASTVAGLPSLQSLTSLGSLKTLDLDQLLRVRLQSESELKALRSRLVDLGKKNVIQFGKFVLDAGRRLIKEIAPDSASSYNKRSSKYLIDYKKLSEEQKKLYKQLTHSAVIPVNVLGRPYQVHLIGNYLYDGQYQLQKIDGIQSSPPFNKLEEAAVLAYIGSKNLIRKTLDEMVLYYKSMVDIVASSRSLNAKIEAVWKLSMKQAKEGAITQAAEKMAGTVVTGMILPVLHDQTKRSALLFTLRKVVDVGSEKVVEKIVKKILQKGSKLSALSKWLKFSDSAKTIARVNARANFVTGLLLGTSLELTLIPTHAALDCLAYSGNAKRGCLKRQLTYYTKDAMYSIITNILQAYIDLKWIQPASLKIATYVSVKLAMVTSALGILSFPAVKFIAEKLLNILVTGMIEVSRFAFHPLINELDKHKFIEKAAGQIVQRLPDNLMKCQLPCAPDNASRQKNFGDKPPISKRPPLFSSPRTWMKRSMASQLGKAPIIGGKEGRSMVGMCRVRLPVNNELFPGILYVDRTAGKDYNKCCFVFHGKRVCSGGDFEIFVNTRARWVNVYDERLPANTALATLWKKHKRMFFCRKRFGRDWRVGRLDDYEPLRCFIPHGRGERPYPLRGGIQVMTIARDWVRPALLPKGRELFPTHKEFVGAGNTHTSVLVYEDWGFRGRRGVLRGSHTNLARLHWGNRISCMHRTVPKATHTPQAIFFDGKGYRGSRMLFYGTDRVCTRGGKVHFNDRASSLLALDDYVCRAEHKGMLIPGSVRYRKCVVPFAGKAFASERYEMLVKQPGHRWVRFMGQLPASAVQAGFEGNHLMYVCRVRGDARSIHAYHIGKLHTTLKKCFFVRGHREVHTSTFELLVDDPERKLGGVKVHARGRRKASFMSLAVAPDGRLWTIRNGRVHRSHGGMSVAQSLPLLRVSVGVDGTTMGIGVGNSVMRWIGGTRWQHFSGKLREIAVLRRNKMWGINTKGYVVVWQKHKWVATRQRADRIAVGRDGSLWCLRAGRIYHKRGRRWRLVKGQLSELAVVHSRSLWGINRMGHLYHRSAGRWKRLPGRLVSLSANAKGQVYGLSHFGGLYRWNGRSWKRLQ